MTTFGDMVFHSGGVPVLSGGLPVIAGSVYWVSSLVGSSDNDGTKDRPYNTLSRALDFSTINDCIVLMPGHVENIVTTATFAIDQAGTIVWGLGEYDYRPTFTHTVAAAYAKLEAANVWINNIKFIAGTTATNTGLEVGAKGCKVSNCTFEEVAATTMTYHEALVTSSTDNDADGMVVENCVFYLNSGQSSGAILINGAHNDLKIMGNKISGWWASGGGPILSADTAAMLNLEVGWNMIANTQSTITNTVMGISFDTVTGTGWIHNNYIMTETSGIGPAEGVVVNATCTIGTFNNYVSGESGESGLLTPAVYAS